MEAKGNLHKMRTEQADPVQYFLSLDSQELLMNELIGASLHFTYELEINCIKCGRKTSKSFAQGFCFPCFQSAPETEECVLRPELCRAHEGIARDMEYAKEHCLIEQIVYLSLTSDVKVGVTRSTQKPFRWIDQGATAAIELARTPNRYIAGQIEVLLKEYLKDRTNWRAMLKNEISGEKDLQKIKHKMLDQLSSDFRQYAVESDEITQLTYPVQQYPHKVVSLNFDKTPEIEGKLIGIKGQYLIFDEGKVLNIRKFGGYKVRLHY